MKDCSKKPNSSLVNENVSEIEVKNRKKECRNSKFVPPTSAAGDHNQPTENGGQNGRGENEEMEKEQGGEETAIRESTEDACEWQVNAERLACETNADRSFLDDYIRGLHEQLDFRASLRQLNVAAETGREERNAARLDSSLKRNTAFVRRLRCFGEQQLNAVLRDLSSLNLSKYVSEAAAAIVEVKLKMSDVPATVTVCSRLHQLYADFSEHLLENWQRSLLPQSGTSGGAARSINAAKLRVDLRFYGELVSVRVLPRREGLQVLGGALTALIQQDRTEHRHSNVLATFCRFCGEEYAGLVPTRVRRAAASLGRALPSSDTIPAEKQRNVRQLFVDYLTGLQQHLLREHQQLLMLQRACRQQLRVRGEISSERQQQQQEQEAVRDRLLSAARQLCELLDEPLPELPEDADEQAERQLLATAMEQGILADGENDGGGAWEDEEQRIFYTSLSDLRATLPSILYSESQWSGPAQPDESRQPDQIDDIPEDVEDPSADADPAVSTDPDEEAPQTASGGSANKQLMDAFIAALSTRVSRQLVDEAAIEFCQRLNTRGNRRRLVRALFAVPRQRIDLLPFYSRLVATLHPCMPDVAVDLGAALKAEFQWQVRKKDQINIESKLKVMRFIGELVKFGVYSRNEALWCVRQLLNDFAHHHVEMACALLESCGRFLYCTAQSHVLTKQYLEQIMRRRVAMPMDGRHVNIIDNMYYAVVPSDPAKSALNAARKIQRPPLHNYIRQLVFEQLNKTNVVRVVRQLRKLDWNDAPLVEFCIGCLSSAWQVRYLHVRSLACAVATLAKYQPVVAVRVVDNVLEDIRLGMEADDHQCSGQFKQRRVAAVRYLAELYTYRLLDTNALLRVMYSLLAFALSDEDEESWEEKEPATGDQHEDDKSQELQEAASERLLMPISSMSDVDSTGGEVRLHLALLLLETCGVYFSGSAQRDLDQYLVVLQCYYWRRRTVYHRAGRQFPVRLEHRYVDVLRLVQPHGKLYSGRRQAELAVRQLQEKLMEKVAPQLRAAAASSNPATIDLPVIAEEELEMDSEGHPLTVESSSDEEEEDDGMECDDDDEEEDIVENGTDSESPDELSGESPLPAVNTDQGAPADFAPRLIECPEDDDFMSAFDRMIYDSLTERSRDSSTIVKQELSAPPPVTLSPTPTRKNYRQLCVESSQRSLSTTTSTMSTDSPANDDGVSVTVMLRRGQRSTHRQLVLPADTELAVCLRSRADEERRERQRVKQLTLDFSQRQEIEQQQQLSDMMKDTSSGGGVFNSSPVRQFNQNRDRRGRHQPAKGAPDADLIFGSKRVSHR